MGYTLLNCFPEIDFICSGEGDIAFLEFAKNFIIGKEIPKINGILDRKSSLLEINLTSPVLNMNHLPFPNCLSIFQLIKLLNQ